MITLIGFRWKRSNVWSREVLIIRFLLGNLKITHLPQLTFTLKDDINSSGYSDKWHLSSFGTIADHSICDRFDHSEDDNQRCAFGCDMPLAWRHNTENQEIFQDRLEGRESRWQRVVVSMVRIHPSWFLNKNSWRDFSESTSSAPVKRRVHFLSKYIEWFVLVISRRGNTFLHSEQRS